MDIPIQEETIRQQELNQPAAVDASDEPNVEATATPSDTIKRLSELYPIVTSETSEEYLDLNPLNSDIVSELQDRTVYD